MEPNTNWGIFGHTWAVDMLRQHILRERVRHAYLFTGPQGIGRRTLALAFAQTLNCPQPLAPGEPCQTCHTCRRIREMVFPDLSVVQAEQVGGVLKVDQVRELQRSLALAPYEGRYRVALLLRMEEAHVSASNALLKTLEEPNPQVVLLLTAADAESLLPTIVSRCEVLRLRPLPLELVRQNLQDRLGFPPEDALLLSGISNGRPGYAINLHDNQTQRDQREEYLNDLLGLLNASRVERFAYAEAHTTDRDRDKQREKVQEVIQHILPLWTSFWRDVLLQTAGTVETPANLDFQVQINTLAGQLDLQQVYRLVAQTELTLANIIRNVNARMAMEVLLLDLPRLPQVNLG